MVIQFTKLQNNTLEKLSIGRNNNFNLIRVIAAIMVIISHSFATTGSTADPLQQLIGLSFGTLAVNIFFVTSGFLVFKSFVERPFPYYIQSRILRIFPGLFVCNIITILFIGIFVTNASFIDYFMNHQIFRYLVNNTLLLRKGIEYFLPGAFTDNIIKSVNGSLWTLPSELKMYILIPFIGLLGLHRKKLFFNLIFILISILIIIIKPSATTYFQYYFLIGIFIYLNKKHIVLNHYLAFGVIIVMISLYLFYLPFLVLFLPFLVSYLVFYFSYCIKGVILLYNRFGDFSYGLYIYAFPTQQTIYYFIKPSIFEMLILSFLLTLIMAVISWYIVEKPAMKLKSNTTLIKSLLNNVGLSSI